MRERKIEVKRSSFPINNPSIQTGGGGVMLRGGRRGKKPGHVTS